MKKFLISIFAVFYLGVASGATVHFHYCMGELLSWGLTKSASKACDNCGMEKSGTDSEKCCKDEAKQVKVEKAQKAETNFQFGKLTCVAIVNNPSQLPPAALSAVTAAHPLSHAPPRAGKKPAFLLNCNFRI